ncbi:MAG: hypothetical protein MJZ16_04770 [Bacteroidales bacterium]|nr:hypothetical protein [Bacteroidales bacterium]
MKKIITIALSLCVFVASYAQDAALRSYTGTAVGTGETITESVFTSLSKTTVFASNDSPTGYFVTFRHYAPNAKSVRIQGEWGFSRLDDATAKTSTNATPFEWKDGDVNWITTREQEIDMKLNQSTGIWFCTVPLPAGAWRYKFIADGKDAWDANNPARNRGEGAPGLTGEDYFSHIYVPHDKDKQAKSDPRLEEAPRNGQNGSISFVTLDDFNGYPVRFGVYLPYGFNKNRKEKYPVLVLMHGGGGTESSWMNNSMPEIMDNLIAEGRVEPMVVLTPNGNVFHTSGGEGWNRGPLDDMIIEKVLPYAEKHFNISKDVNKRAFTGLSMGGATAMYTFLNHPEAFRYFHAMSAPTTKDIVFDLSNPLLKDRKVMLTVGMYDFVKVEALLNLESAQAKKGERSFYTYLFELTKAGIPVKTQPELTYGHNWTLWRKNLVTSVEGFLWK